MLISRNSQQHHRPGSKYVPGLFPDIRPDMSIAVDAIEKRYFELGWDWGGFSGIDLPDDATHDMRIGWTAARRKLSNRPADRFERKWLWLRFNALRRNRVVDNTVTPELIRNISPATCPVTLERLEYASGTELDWSIDRLFNDGGYALGNIATMSVRANKAKGNLGILDVMQFAAEMVGTGAELGGLSGNQWARLSAMMVGPHAFATREVYLVPQCTTIPTGTPAQPTQELQCAILSSAIGGQRENVIGGLRARSTREGERILHKLIQAIRHKAGRNAWVYDVWLEPGVFDRFEDWFATMDPSQVQRVYDFALSHDGIRRSSINRESALQAWAVPTHGYAVGTG